MSLSSAIAARAFGNGEIEQEGSDAPVPWWSFTKTVLAAAALQLVANGRLTLEQPLAGRPYSLRQLLQHRAGLSCYGSLESYHAAVEAGEEPWSEDELWGQVKADELRFPPDSDWHYSNVGYLLVRRSVEEASGLSLQAALQQLVFKPLGITGICVALEPEHLHSCAWGNTARYHPGWVYHGLLIGPAQDALRCLRGLLSGALLPAELLTRMTTPHWLEGVVPGRPWEKAGYGLGLMIGEMAGAGRAIGHSGGGPGSTNAVYHFCELPLGRTVAVFVKSEEDGMAESMALRFALRAQK